MGIDLLLALFLLAAIYFGYQRGLILAVFSLVSLWLGILLAFKFSALVATWLGDRIDVSDKWLPILAFVIVLIGVVILVRLGAKALESALELAQLGMLNRLAGSVLYVILFLSVSAALLQGLQWAGAISDADRQDSIYLLHVQPLFMQGAQALSGWTPGLSDVFDTLRTFFDAVPASPEAL